MWFVTIGEVLLPHVNLTYIRMIRA